MKRIMALLLLAGVWTWADPSVQNIKVEPRCPWNGLVDITYSITCGDADTEGKPKDVYVSFSGYDNVRQRKISLRTLSGDGAKDAVKVGGPYKVTWNAGKDQPQLASTDFQLTVHAISGIAPYLVVDLSGGTMAASYPWRYSDTGPDVTQDTCRTTELWLRQIPAGTFTMGSPTDELGRASSETQHQVTITQMFYIGLFECTQRQWELVMGTQPSRYKGDARPVECVSYDMIRGTGAQAGAGWPAYGHTVDASSFMGKLQQKTGLVFDLPTEANWEYACRKRADGTCWTTALNSGKNLTDYFSCSNLAEVGRYGDNNSDGKGGYSQHAKVGSYQPSELGLYDMHGGVFEWCVDYWDAGYNGDATDPVGATSGTYRVLRGGCWRGNARFCRAAYRYRNNPSYNFNDYTGLRLACFPLCSD